jgi:hypothetical protein
MNRNTEDTLLREFLALMGKEPEAAKLQTSIRETVNAALAELTDPTILKEEAPDPSTPSPDDLVREMVAGVELRSTVSTAGLVGQIIDQTTSSQATSSGSSLLTGLTQQASGLQSLIGGQQVDAGQRSSGGVTETLLDVASTVLRGGLGLTPLLSKLFGLFGGDDEPAPEPLVKYALPSALQFQAAVSPDGLATADSDQYGFSRAYAKSETSSATQTQSPAVTVNVQAMDARSFLDHSTEIAAAVREAMLNLNSINDVMADL